MAILKNLIVEGDTRIIGDTNTAKITTGDIIVQECNNSWLTPARLQIGRINSSAYSDRACVGVTDGNLHIDPYPNKTLYLSYYNQGTINLGRSASVTSGGAIYGTAIYDNGTRVLTSHQTLKTINSQSIVGSGNVSVGTYSKPSGGIPKTDLASAVQTSLNRADNCPVIPGSGTNSILGKNVGDGYFEIEGDGSLVYGYADTDGYIAASGIGATANGYVIAGTNNNITASGDGSHAEGCIEIADYEENCISANGNGSFARGYIGSGAGGSITAQGDGSIAEGYADEEGSLLASGDGSYAHGYCVEALNDYEHSIGVANVSNNGNTPATQTLFSVGCGDSTGDHANALEIMRNGDVYVKGIGGYNGTNPNTETARPIQQLLNMAPTIRYVYDSNNNIDRYIHVYHPLMDYHGAEVVLVRYHKKCGKKRGNKHWIYKKGWCVASGQQHREYFVFDKRTDKSDFNDFITNHIVQRKQHFGIALRIPNPKWTRSSTELKNGIYEGVPESLWSDVLPIMIGQNQGIGLI